MSVDEENYGAYHFTNKEESDYYCELNDKLKKNFLTVLSMQELL